MHRLQQIHDYIAHDQPQNAKRFVDRLTRRAEAIARHPLAGRIVPEYRSDTVRETFEGAPMVGIDVKAASVYSDHGLSV